jgi:acetoacetyl-CoA reductase/3-oxoacyl-[acyl-carrier protein] reductase
MAIAETHHAYADSGESLHGRVALVTGGTRGIGAAICRRLAAHGASVAASYGHDHESARRLQTELAAAGAPISIHVGDVGSADDCRRTVQDVIDHHGRLDILVNNAGFSAQAALPQMVERGSGRIVNISSIIGQTGNIGQANYAASKSGLFGLTMSLAKEAAFALKRAGKLTPDGPNITVNAVAPGFIETEMLDGVPEKVLDQIRSAVPLQRLGRPEEVARVVHFLSADASSYITGQVWAVNGGQEM